MPIAELRHLTGRIGELYVAMMTLGRLTESADCPADRATVLTEKW